MIIRAFTPSDSKAVGELISRSFGQRDEADLVETLRSNGDMALELVAENRKKVVGHIALSRMRSPAGWLALAPVCIEPKLQRRGIGSVLCQTALQYANAPVVVLGEPAFYERFGFDFSSAGQIQSPFPVEFTGIFYPEGMEVPSEIELLYAAPFLS